MHLKHSTDNKTTDLISTSLTGGFKWLQANKGDMIPDTKYTVMKLEAEQLYEFRIAAENKAGVGPASDPTIPTVVKERVGEY